MRVLLPLGLLLFAVILPVPATPQYLFLDTNGDGVHDERDQLAPTGTTSVDIWVVTDRNRDGTPVSCDVEDAGNGLTLNSYTVVLHAAGGDVKFGPMQNRLPFSVERPACFATYEDTTNVGWYHNGWGWMDQFAPGKHKVATIAIQVLSGNPSIMIAPYLPRRVTQITAFGTSCMGFDGDNTYKLGSDWNDADGLGPPRADAGGPYQVQAGRPLRVDGTGSRLASGATMSYSWDFGDGGVGSGAITTHVYGSAGDYRLVLSVAGGNESDTDTTNVHVVPAQAPFARITGTPVAYVGVPAVFDGSTSYDPDGDALVYYRWDFGDGSRADGIRIPHTYTSAGAKSITLVVSDGMLTDTATKEVSVYAIPHPPVAVVGGPYAGIMGRAINFNGTASSDPDGDPLTYVWSFGDRTTGTGPVPAHAYEAPGMYVIDLTVSDGGLTASEATTAMVTESLPGHAFSDGAARYTLGQAGDLTVHLESADPSYRVQDITPWPILLRVSASGTVGEIFSVADATITPGHGNQKPFLTFTFGPEELALLLGHAEAHTTVTAHVRATFFGGGYVDAELPVHIDAPETASQPLQISPNPFNPEAVVTFSTSKPGPVRAHLFDVRGHLVRTIQYGPMDAGRHVLTLDARSGAGAVLASGIYFFRLTSADGVETRRVAVAK